MSEVCLSQSGHALRVSAILVSYNTRDLTCRAVRALRESSIGGEIQIIVVDNNSRDGTVEALRKQDPEVLVIENHDNRGFGAANNQGMRAASEDVEYFLLINTDAFVEPDKDGGPGAVDRLVKRLDENSKLGVVGPKLLNTDGSLQVSCFGFPTPLRAWVENLGLDGFTRVGRFDYGCACEVDFVSGACMLVRALVVKQTAGFDEDFFMYSEETDWQRRMKKAGWRVGFEPSAVVTHLGGGSQVADKINPEFFRSLDRYVCKHHGRLGLLLFQAAMGVGAIVRLPIRWVLAQRHPLHRAKLLVHCYVLRRLLLGDAAAASWIQAAR